MRARGKIRVNESALRPARLHDNNNILYYTQRRHHYAIETLNCILLLFAICIVMRSRCRRKYGIVFLFEIKMYVAVMKGQNAANTISRVFAYCVSR